jgi:hypothetical protein
VVRPLPRACGLGWDASPADIETSRTTYPDVKMRVSDQLEMKKLTVRSNPMNARTNGQ